MFAASKTANVSGAANYIEDVFSTYLYTGTGATRTITNNVDLSTKSGLVWIKSRSAATNNNLFDTVTGATKVLHSNTVAGSVTDVNSLTAFTTSGFTLGSGNTSGNQVNTSGATYASWTFQKKTKFFDIISYTGDGATTKTLAHNLGSTPGCIIVKRTETGSVGSWFIYHVGLNNSSYYVALNSTNAQANGGTSYFSATPTSTEFYVGDSTAVNELNGSYVAYLFANNAGGFGLTGADNVISCGSYTGNGSATGPVINLGYEAQWVLIKNAGQASTNWALYDNMRGMPVANNQANGLAANTALAEDDNYPSVTPTSTGFKINNGTSAYVNTNGQTYIYIAVRRGPMKVPTDATTVFSPVTQSANTSTVTTNFPVDLSISAARNGADDTTVIDRLRGGVQTTNSNWLYTDSTSNEGNATGTAGLGLDNSTGIVNNYWGSVYRANTGDIAYWSFKRAPTFFDEVCYKGTGSNTTQTHNLGAVPELIIVKSRSASYAWDTYSSSLANTEYIVLNTNAAKATGATRWNSTTPTSSVFSIGTSTTTNASGATFVAYLFATCSGVSKVGSYTGNGTTQTINCGFSGGARFVLIKRTDSTGDWYVYDTARGMTVLTDPYLLLDSLAAEVATLGSVTTVTTGFALNSSILADINVNGGTYIFLAIA